MYILIYRHRHRCGYIYRVNPCVHTSYSQSVYIQGAHESHAQGTDPRVAFGAKRKLIWNMSRCLGGGQRRDYMSALCAPPPPSIIRCCVHTSHSHMCLPAIPLWIGADPVKSKARCSQTVNKQRAHEHARGLTPLLVVCTYLIHCSASLRFLCE